jgi:hypothetical protein
MTLRLEQVAAADRSKPSTLGDREREFFDARRIIAAKCISRLEELGTSGVEVDVDI